MPALEKLMKSSNLIVFMTIAFCWVSSPLVAVGGERLFFEAAEDTWIVTPRDMEIYDSEVAGEALQVVSETNERGQSVPAWIGDDPGDLGPMWTIQDAEGEVLGACWSYYDDPATECIPLYVPFSTDLD